MNHCVDEVYPEEVLGLVVVVGDTLDPAVGV
jgi:hypothetical protein